MDFRNICIIAHVDHGKTTLVDHLLRQAGTFSEHQAVVERVMDSMDLEKERGITIQAKNTSVQVGDTKINIVDTPGHADFGGEVERIINMVDGAILLVDAAEGPLPQTRFVLQHALAAGHKIVLVINKVDRPECRGTSRINDVINSVFDLFLELGASEQQADFPIVYACAKQGWSTTDDAEVEKLVKGEAQGDLKPLFNLILDVMPKPPVNVLGGFQMLVSNLGYSDYVGRLAIGRVMAGSVCNAANLVCKGEGEQQQPTTHRFVASKVSTFKGLREVEVDELEAGDIGIIAGTDEVSIGDSLVSGAEIPALPRIAVAKPTLAMTFSVNTSPFSGREGEAVQSRKLRERLLREVRHNVAFHFEDTALPDQFRVLAKGELQLAILIEQMRRENLEFMVAKTMVLTKKGDKGETLEPVELVVIDTPEETVGDVSQLFQQRKGILAKYEAFASNVEGVKKRVRLEFEIPTRGLLGTSSRFLTLTRGEGLMSARFAGYQPSRGSFLHRTNGAIIADREGRTVEYAMLNLEDRGIFFHGPGTQVYEGMVIGEHNKVMDINVNVCKEKKLTNIRAAHAEVLVRLAGLRAMSLEQCIEWIDEDEWIEVTPKSIRIRKKVLPQNKRQVRRG